MALAAAVASLAVSASAGEVPNAARTAPHKLHLHARPGPKPHAPASIRSIKVMGVWVQVVQVDLRRAAVRVRALRAQDLKQRFCSFQDFVRYSRPLVAVTGTFFDPQSGRIICNLVRQGRLLESGAAGNTMSILSHNRVRWTRTAGVAGGRHRWAGQELAVSGGPTLARLGRVALAPGHEGFSDPHLLGKARRIAMGTTRSGKLLLVSVKQPIGLARLAKIMVKLGSEHAMNLDGGSSAALYARGRYLSLPTRRLTNVLLVDLRRS